MFLLSQLAWVLVLEHSCRTSGLGCQSPFTSGLSSRRSSVQHWALDFPRLDSSRKKLTPRSSSWTVFLSKMVNFPIPLKETAGQLIWMQRQDRSATGQPTRKDQVLECLCSHSATARVHNKYVGRLKCCLAARCPKTKLSVIFPLLFRRAMQSGWSLARHCFGHLEGHRVESTDLSGGDKIVEKYRYEWHQENERGVIYDTSAGCRSRMDLGCFTVVQLMWRGRGSCLSCF